MSSVSYSPVCDVDKGAYLSYLAACIVRDGSISGRTLSFGRGSCDNEGSSGCVSDGEYVVGLLRGLCMAAQPVEVGNDCDRPVDSVRGDFCDIASNNGGKSKLRTSGLADCHDGGRDSGVDSGFCDGRTRVCEQASGRGSSIGVGLELGPNTLANREKRRKCKERRQRKKERHNQDIVVESKDVPEWRRNAGKFDGCSVEVVTELRESYADLLIKRNKRQAIEETRKLARLQSPVTVVRDAMRLVEESQKYGEMASKHEIAGWAHSIVSSTATSVAKSVPSSVPSVNSVSSANSLEKKKKGLRLSVAPLNGIEQCACNAGIITESQIQEARFKSLRMLTQSDFLATSFPYPMSPVQRSQIVYFE